MIHFKKESQMDRVVKPITINKKKARFTKKANKKMYPLGPHFFAFYGVSEGT
jgi:hypothetical protein